jgi:hypothetical protein
MPGRGSALGADDLDESEEVVPEVNCLYDPDDLAGCFEESEPEEEGRGRTLTALLDGDASFFGLEREGLEGDVLLAAPDGDTLLEVRAVVTDCRGGRMFSLGSCGSFLGPLIPGLLLALRSDSLHTDGDLLPDSLLLEEDAADSFSDLSLEEESDF